MREYNSRLRPLISDIDKSGIGYYLVTSNYERIMVFNGFEEVWQEGIKVVDKERRVISLLHDERPYDAEKAFKFIINLFFDHNIGLFYRYLHVTLKGYIEWGDNERDLDDIFKDLMILDFPDNSLTELLELRRKKNTAIKAKKNSEELLEADDIIEKRKVLSEKKLGWSKLIRKAKIEDLIDEICIYSDDSGKPSLREDITNISARYYRVKDKAIAGIIGLDAENLEMNKINKALTDLISKID